MILLLDIGNTRIKWAALDGAQLHPAGATVHLGELERVTSGWIDAARPERVFAVSVAGSKVNEAVAEWVAQHWGIAVQWLRPGRGPAGMTTRYVDPSRLGADRWAASVGAFRLSGKAVCVVDCGSAITFDAVAANGNHLGGLIVPGWRLMRMALHAGTAALPYAAAGSVSLLATDTVTAISSGTLLGAAAMVETLSQRIVEQIGGDVDLWLTGGDAAAVQPHLRLDFKHAPDLVLQGLAAMVETF
ncbi:MAG TPA: type III pantothenate kinase [Gammaproteobacteria bacterium]|nr:type III pantothenate kinase [Gammaproteobacteria bacterium]